MTPIARTVIISGLVLFTAGTLLWITTGTWQWFAGGGSIFLCSIIAGGVLSTEVKHPQRPQRETYREPSTHTNDNDNDNEQSEETSKDSDQTRTASFDMWSPDPER